MRDTLKDFKKWEDRLERGRVELRKQLGLPPYVPHGQRGKPGYAQKPNFKATSKSMSYPTFRKDGEQ